ncbi:hypothetical protein B0H13DRAFT_1880640 [Mycena leptocephala]|nr:hypothetical protein B0H13DRAFT_1880640 [Mycena leptocephala]
MRLQMVLEKHSSQIVSVAQTRRGTREVARTGEDVQGGQGNVPASPPRKVDWRAAADARMYTCVEDFLEETDSMRRDFRGRRRWNEGETQRESAGVASVQLRRAAMRICRRIQLGAGLQLEGGEEQDRNESRF